MSEVWCGVYLTTIGIVWDWVMGLVWPLVSDDRGGGSLVVGGG